MDRNELLSKIHQGRTRLEAALAKFSDEQMTSLTLKNGWTFKDTLAHIGFWEHRAAALYQILKRGETPDGVATDAEVDALNAKAHAENQNRSLAEVRQTEQGAYQELLVIAEAAPEADLFDPQRFPWTGGVAFVEHIAANTYDHYDEHLAMLS